MERPKFYMQVFGKETVQPIIDLEDFYKGMYFAKVSGLSDKGKPKNIYTEEYADSDALRVHLPETVYREATKIVLSLVFVGENRRDIYDSFYNYVNGEKLYYWDSARNRKASMVLEEPIEIDEDILVGSQPYIVVDFRFRNLYGECEKVD